MESRERGGDSRADRQYQRILFYSRVWPIFLRFPSRSVSLGEALKPPNSLAMKGLCVFFLSSRGQRLEPLEQQSTSVPSFGEIWMNTD